jgi:hypothetical protein
MEAAASSDVASDVVAAAARDHLPSAAEHTAATSAAAISANATAAEASATTKANITNTNASEAAAEGSSAGIATLLTKMKTLKGRGSSGGTPRPKRKARTRETTTRSAATA